MEDRYCAVVTGASSGIGAAFAAELASAGHYVVLVARRAQRLTEVLATLPEGSGEALALDVSQPGSAHKALDHLSARRLKPALLVNNAGVGDFAPLLDADPERLHAMIALNSTALLDWTHTFLRAFRSQRRGGIIQVSSGIVFLPAPRMATYAASKAFVHALGQALPAELQGTSIRYMTLYPGSTESEFFLGAGIQRPPGTMSARKVAREALLAFARGRTQHIAGLGNRIGLSLLPLLPKRFVARMVARFMR